VVVLTKLVDKQHLVEQHLGSSAAAGNAARPAPVAADRFAPSEPVVMQAPAVGDTIPLSETAALL